MERQLIPLRTRPGAKSAILFLHGFTGNPDGTFDRFPYLLGTDVSLNGWDILSLGYHTSFLPGTRGVWSADPDLPTLAQLFSTELGIPPLSNYQQLAVIAHSMGGLIAQRALLDDPPDLTRLVRYLFLFGTPSAGLKKASFIRKLLGPLAGDQVQNMASDSQFVTTLRAGWSTRFANDPPFQFYAIAGDKDNFVTANSSLGPFDRKYQRVVSGDHLSMVKPRDASFDVVRLVISLLTKTAEPAGPSSPLRAAAELGALAPQGIATALAAAAGTQQLATQAEVVECALALDRANNRDGAIQLLERYQNLGTDVKGTLAGRVKRQWLQNGQDGDAHWALGLYESALAATRKSPEKEDFIDQMFYHAINVAFLKFVAFNQLDEAKQMASLALEYARKKSPVDIWSVATEGEANLYLGDYDLALSKYKFAIEMRPETWKLISTGQQAQQLAAKLGNQDLQVKLSALFDPPQSAKAAGN
jgi:pimeloyl-ACP methyl ester carboxylesterase